MNVHLSEEKNDGLIYDLEVSAAIGEFYPPEYKTRIQRVLRPQLLIGFSYRWASEGKKGKTHYLDLRDSSTYKLDPLGQRELTKALHDLFEHAAYTLAYNGDGFDKPMAQTFFVREGFKSRKMPTIDPCKVARKEFRLSSNRMDNVAAELGIKRKLNIDLRGDTAAFLDEGDERAANRIKRYCVRDTNVLYDIDQIIRVYATTYLNLANLQDEYDACPRCQSTEHMVEVKGRFFFTNANRYRRWVCEEKTGGCGYRARERRSVQVSPTKFQ